MYVVPDDPVEMNLTGLSLRDANKRRTAHILRRTAMRLFVKRGYDATTAEDIAEKAGVSVRTFFRYYATKDELVLRGQGTWARGVVARYLEQPDDVPAIAALGEVLAHGASDLDRKAVATYGKIVDGSQALRGKVAQMVAASNAEIANAVAERSGLDAPDTRARLITEIAFATYQSALKDWRDEREPGELEAVIRARFAMLTSLFDDTVARKPPKRRVAARRA